MPVPCHGKIAHRPASTGGEPVDHQQEIAQGLPPVVPAADVGPLVPQHMVQGLPVQAGGYINAGPPKTQEEGRGESVTGIDPDAQRHRGGDALDQLRVTEHRCHQQNSNPNQPEQGEERKQDLQGVDVGHRGGGEGLGQYGVHRSVDEGDPRVDHRLLQAGDVGGYGLAAGDQTQRTFQGKGERQPDAHRRPQQTYEPAGGFFQQQPCQRHGQDQPARGDAHVQDFQKHRAHVPSSPRKASIIRWISAASFAVSPFLDRKAATKAGRDPR